MSRGNRSFVSLIVGLLVVGLGIIAYLMSRSSATPSIQTVQAPVAPGAAGAAGAAANAPAQPEHVMGSDSAPVELVMFGDFECPGCGQYFRLTEPDVRTRLIETGKVRFRFRDWPIPEVHPATLVAHNAAWCAGAQGKFWPMHDTIFAGQLEWSQFANGKPMGVDKIMKRYASKLGLDTKAFDACLDSRIYESQIRASRNDAQALGVGGTPTFMVGTHMLPTGHASYDEIKALVDSGIADAKKKAPSSTKAPRDSAKKQ